MVLYICPSLETRVDLGTTIIEVATRAGKLAKSEYCSSHDRDLCEGTMSFCYI